MNSDPDNPGPQAPGRKKTRPALLVIDTQNKYLKIVPPRDKEMGIFFINLLTGLFRQNGFPVIRIYHADKDKQEDTGSEEFRYPTSILTDPADKMLVKTYSDSFNKTGLDDMLKESGSNTIFICGFSAVGCVIATMIGAMNHDHQAFIVKDAIMSHSTECTRNAEAMFDAISYNAVRLILETC